MACPLALHEATANATLPFVTPVNVAPAGAAKQTPALAADNPASPMTRDTRRLRFIRPHNTSTPVK
jgi:hypothetical protein